LSLSCGQTKPSSAGAGGSSGSGGLSGGNQDSGMDQNVADGSGGLAPCLDQPSALPLPPSTRLPCELIPPGLKL